MRNESIEPSRPTIIPSGKFADTPIAMLSTEDLAVARREFSRVDPAVQGAIMSELARRERSAARQRLRRQVRGGRRRLR